MSPTLETVEVPLQVDEDCVACAERLHDGLAQHRGIAAVEPAASGSSVLVRYDPDLCSLDCLERTAQELRVELAGHFEHQVLRVSGMDCYDCAQTIERAVGRLPGVTYASVNFPAARMRVEYRPATIDMERVAKSVSALGYQVSDAATAQAAQVAAPLWKRRDVTTSTAAALLALAFVLDLATSLRPLALALYAATILIGGFGVARSGLAALRGTRRPDINFLMTIAVIGAAAIGAWLEAGLVVVLFSVGEALEGRAVERARRELAGLVSLAPETARVRRSQTREGEASVEEVEVPIAELAVGDLAVIRPGERIPSDGIVTEGASAVDQAPITGESTPVDKETGDQVFAGTLNTQGLLIVEVRSAPGDTTLDKIARLVTEAQARKSPSERWVDAFAKVYTPIVIGVAILVATVPLGFGVSFATAFYAALALLILACPCALVISTPVSIVSALGRASAAGVLVKGGAYLERIAQVDTVAFDKTGTLTTGKPQVVAIEALDGTEDRVLTVAAGLEQGSEHPLAQAILAAARGGGLTLAPVEDFQALTGLGAQGRVAGEAVRVGNPRLFGETLDVRTRAAVDRLEEGGRTVVVVEVEGSPIGVLGLADEPRPEAGEAIAALSRLGIERTVLLTGDNRATAEAIGRRLGITDVRAELLPQDKAAAVTALGGSVAMVGDGVNDAPALAAADVGIAMGSAGSDTAIEVADVALMGDDPRKAAGLVGLARWTRSVVRQNIAFSLGTKLLALVVLAGGALPLWAAVATDVGASLIVVANGLRLLRRSPRGRLRGLPLLEAPPRRESAASKAFPIVLQPAAGADGCADDCCPTEINGVGVRQKT